MRCWLLVGLVSTACGDESPNPVGSGGSGPGGGGGAGGAEPCPTGSHRGDDGTCEASLGAFGETSSIADARDHHVTWAATKPGGSFLYVAGGALNMMTGVTTIERAAIGADGMLSAWETLPQSFASAGPMVASTDARVFFAGGIRTGGNSTKSESAAMVDDGSLGPLEPGPALHIARFHGAAVLHDGWIYATGGLDATGTSTAVVERVAIDDSGFQGNWLTETAELPEPRSHHGLALHDGVLYLTGGLTRVDNQFQNDVAYDTVLRSTIQSDGSLGAWSVAGTLPLPIVVHSSFVHADHLYLVGGLDMNTLQFLDSVWRTPLDDLDVWEELPVTLPISRGHCHQTPLVDGFLYSIAGTNDAGSQTAAFVAVFE
jgi:hypothetical protein